MLIFLGSMGRGGAERVISLISDYFVKQNWDVTIALLLTYRVDYPLDERIKVVDLSYGGGSRIKRLPKWFFGIRKLVKEERPDTILSFAARINVIVQSACIGLGQNIVVSERNDPYMDGRGRFVDLMTTIFYPKAKAVVFQTKRAESYFSKLKLKNTTIIANPISVACERGNMCAGKIVSVGRLSPQKNQKMLIRAFSRILPQFPNAELYIYGEGELRKELTAMIVELGLNEKVHLPGNVLNLHETISDANAFVLPSDYEGLSNALCEALMMGLPVISTNCSGSDEYITNGENGILIDVGNEDELVNALTTVLQSDELAIGLGTKAKEQSIIFEKERILQAWYSLLDKN